MSQSFQQTAASVLTQPELVTTVQERPAVTHLE